MIFYEIWFGLTTAHPGQAMLLAPMVQACHGLLPGTLHLTSRSIGWGARCILIVKVVLCLWAI